ncbi:hypothetical protein GPL17_26745 [Bradyrhizobium yuanmingense]|uniref:hypothetical protein n=1 Tax=Bradyrhizobium yuanmingense TaxID=108015 RepID=UPI0012F9CBA2|nr:hypothetical protein [Bradyrhizobium yuanmingense]MVT54076.1 hypothetical protein [Bradyrhizobium yuanmingense]
MHRAKVSVFVLLFENVLRRDRFVVLIGANLKTADQEQLLSLVFEKEDPLETNSTGDCSRRDWYRYT